jgi:hypothetical protein
MAPVKSGIDAVCGEAPSAPPPSAGVCASTGGVAPQAAATDVIAANMKLSRFKAMRLSQMLSACSPSYNGFEGPPMCKAAPGWAKP